MRPLFRYRELIRNLVLKDLKLRNAIRQGLFGVQDAQFRPFFWSKSNVKVLCLLER
jgi:hypothetical protein